MTPLDNFKSPYDNKLPPQKKKERERRKEKIAKGLALSLKRRAVDNIRILVTTREDSCLSLSLRNNNRKWLEAGEFRLGRSFLKLVN